MKGQFFPYIVFPNNINEKQKGDNHRTAVFGTGLSLCYDFYDNFNLPVRAELDFTSRANADYNYSKSQENSIFFLRNTIKNQIEANTLMFNAYYDFKNPSDFTPYLSAGLGYAYLSQKTSQIATLGISGGKTSTETLQTRSHATNNFAWSAGAGIKYTVSQDFSFDLSYKYLDAGQAEVDYFNLDGVETNVKTKVRTHDIMLSATYHF
ncbi:MAG TPA: outer membrane protein [Arsenophonus nasoniae]|uniref:outer membrane protein n=1 Tax=Arsenophonus nasoniae TaxID=638 RepID=UPI003878F789